MSEENAIREADAHSVDGDDALIGQLIDGKYRVEKLIGAGGMGRVYRGRNVRTDSPVAIKTLLPELVTDESLIKRFEIEAKSASNLRHPNTIRIFDFGREGRLLFMVMELLDGSSLEGVLAREGRVEPRRLIQIILQVCRSLAEAHEAGLVHRDLKPDNIFLNRAGGETDFVKVLDFGVAKLRDKKYGQATLTQAGMIFGTPRYMSPEQARALDIDARSDIYALGVIMFECLTGRPPFEAPDPIAVLIKHIQEPIPSFAEVAPDLGPHDAFEAIVRRCMAKQPDDRLPDVRSLMSELEALLGGEVRSTGANSGGGSYATRTLESSPEQTLAQAAAVRPAPNTPAINGLKDPTFQMGGSSTVFGDANPERPARGSLGVALAAVAAVVVLAGVGIFALVGRGGANQAAESGANEPGAEVEPALATAAAAQEPVGDGPPSTAPASLAIAGERIASAMGAARSTADRAVIRVSISDPSQIGVRAAIEGSAGAAMPAPTTLLVVRDPAAEPGDATIRFEVDGREPWTQTVPLAFGNAPIAIAAAPPTTHTAEAERPNGDNPSGGRQPRDNDEPREEVPPQQPTGGLEDPY